jgi:hypothetical protein
MTGGAVVAVVGGYGAVGRATVRLLQDWQVGRLRIGGRSVEAARQLISEELGGDGDAAAVDVWDPASLARFCAGCRVVVNCAGPSYRVLDRVALAALAAGADYVDPGGDAPVQRRLASLNLASRGRTAVLCAGLMPGLTGLLPRWLAGQGFTRATQLTAYVGLVDRLTPIGAAEYLLSLGGGHGESQAAWCSGSRVSRALAPLSEVELPFFPDRVNAHPYLSLEAERLACALGLDGVRWYNVFDGGGQMLTALSRLQGAMMGQADLDAAAAELAQAAELDLFGRAPYQLLVFQLDGEAGGRSLTRTVVLRGTDTYALTGSVTAMAVRELLDGHIAAGVHYAADALDPELVVAWLRGRASVIVFALLDSPAEAGAIEEGVL